MWQVLEDELAGFTVVSVALDADASAAAAVIRRYRTTYPVLIDERHTVAELYGMVNVPSAIWIDEAGQVARPTHIAGMGEDWRYHADRVSPKHEIPAGAREGLRRTRESYLDAVRRWVLHGEHERRDPLPSHDSVAHAHFRLGTYLHEHDLDGAHAHLAEAVRLRPESWNFRRQALALERPDDFWDQFWGAVDATPPGGYYPLEEDL